MKNTVQDSGLNCIQSCLRIATVGDKAAKLSLLVQYVSLRRKIVVIHSIFPH